MGQMHEPALSGARGPTEPKEYRPGSAQPVYQQPSDPYPAQPYPAQPYAAQPYAAQPYAAQAFSYPPTTGMPAIGMPATGMPAAQPPRRTAIVVTIVTVLVLLLIGVVAGGLAARAVWPTLTGSISGSGPGGFAPGGSSDGGTGAGGSGDPGGPGSGSAGSGGAGSDSAGSDSAGAQSGSSDVSAIASRIAPSIVDVNSTLGLQGAEGAGTGIVLTASGEILTNNHVVAGATSISVTDVGNGRSYPATVVGYDRSEDIAVIRLQGASGLQTAPLGDSSTVRAGDSIVALGNAGGVGGAPSAVGGAVTALDQAITASDEGGGNAEQLTGLIQIAANIQPGDSGGPLVDSGGHIIGMDTAASSGFRFQAAGGEGYAIAINHAMAIAKDIMAGHASATIHIGATAMLGVNVANASSGGSSSGGSHSGGSGSGALVATVVSGSPAERAGLSGGDVILSLDGQAIAQASTLTGLLDRHHPGDKVKIGYADGSGQSRTATVQLGTGPTG